MFEYLQKFKTLSPNLRQVVSSPRATQVVNELEKKYGVDLAALVIKVMVKEINWSGLTEFLVQEHHLTPEQAEKLQTELAEKLFRPAAQYLGITPQKQPPQFSRQELEHELAAPAAPKNLPATPTLQSPHKPAPAAVPIAVSIDEQVERTLPQVLQAAGITDKQSVDSLRLQSIMQTFFKGIRDSIDTHETLLKQKSGGGLGLDAAKAGEVMALVKSAKQGKIAAMPSVKKVKSPFDSLEQMRDVEYSFGSKKEEVRSLKSEVPTPEQKKSEFVISAEKLKQAEQVLGQNTVVPAQSAKTNMRPPRGGTADRQDADRTRLDDIFKPPAKMQGPLEELAAVDLTIFRRLGETPEQSVKKIENKIRLLEQESYTRRQQGVSAWRHSPIYAQYLALGEESFSAGKPVEEIIAAKVKAGQPVLSTAEFEAIAELNSILRV
jgi:hypothetical protein